MCSLPTIHEPTASAQLCYSTGVKPASEGLCRPVATLGDIIREQQCDTGVFPEYSGNGPGAITVTAAYSWPGLTTGKAYTA